MNKQYNIKELRKIIQEVVQEFEPVIGANVEKDNIKNNKESYKDAVEKAENYDGGLAEDTDITTVESIVQQAADIDKRGMERLKYDNINKPFQEKVKAQVDGKFSTLQKEIDDKTQGVSTTGNKKFNKKAQLINKFDNEHTGFGDDNAAATQLGNDLEIMHGSHPAKKQNAFESTQKLTEEENKCDGKCVKKVGDNWRVVSGKTGKLWPQHYNSETDAESALSAYHANENKVRVGDVFTEIKSNLRLKYTGLNEDKTKVNFIDESSNKKYSLIKENFKKALKERKILKEFVSGFYNTATHEFDTPIKIGEKYTYKDTEQFNNSKPVFIVKNIVNGEIEAISTDNKYQDKPSNRDFGESLSSGDVTIIRDTNESKTKRINFKIKFMCESHMLSLIPEHYKIDGYKFYMKDSENNEFLIEWQENLKKKCIIEQQYNKKQQQERYDSMKHLWEYKSNDTMGKLDNESKANENNLRTMIDKVNNIKNNK